MLRKLTLAASALIGLSIPAHSQQLSTARVLSGACGTVAPFPPINPGQTAGLFMDASGHLCSSATGGGGGGAVTLAAGSVSPGAYTVGSLLDGASVTMGSVADAVWSGTGSGTEISILKKIAQGGAGGGPVTLASGAVAAGAYVAGSVVAGAFVDGAMVTMGALADAATANTLVGLLKAIKANTAAFTGSSTITGPLGNQLNPAAVAVVSKSGQFTVAGTGLYGQAITSLFTMSVPAGTTAVQISVEGAPARYTTDGVTTPTSTIGHPLAQGAQFQVALTNFAFFKIIGAGATIDLEYFK